MFQKIQLYIISLWFLFLLLFVAKVDIPICMETKSRFIGFQKLIETNGTSLFALFFMIVGGFFYFGFNRNVSRGASLLPKKVVRLKNRNSETLSFLATYVIPLACLDMEKSRSLLLLVFILILIGWIYVKTDLFYTNPTLVILGFKVYQLDTEQTSEMIVVIKQDITVGDYILPRHINENLYYAKLATP